ncbi:thiol reductant ABC exporter subunit CydD [Saccharopolyspora mangrovi]|uniref:Thiol reductant ABC exporter subunit CydD n=1 Tax=Saccharopolyspora mangrovi TaxID=3082379 RepID=A0ABU6A4Y7_9PSEU|nr:thiol reductant ABC exporter subunit CydD [Saccharopolyspora sp. S2-29]MEB3366642.1 thiol reductant ABC exporter subunit CydD [Saccharopolyspora sp. S2-29]
MGAGSGDSTSRPGNALSPLGALPKLSASARRALTLIGFLSACNAVALIVQAWAIATTLAPVVTGGSVHPERLLVLAGSIAARAALAWSMEFAAARAATGAKEELRALLVDAALRRGPEWIQRRGPAQLTALATKGLDSLDAYFTKYLPALVNAAIVPPCVGAWILFSDWVSAIVIALTVPLIPLFAWLVGHYTEKRSAAALDALQRLSARMLELVRALPVFTAFGRASAQVAIVRELSDQQRRTTAATLRVAFLSALVLELFSSLSVAMVAVGIGLRLVSGELDLATGLVVLVLAPECYLPLRAAGAAHHASEDGVEAVRRVDGIVGTTSPAHGRRVPGRGPLVVEGLSVVRRERRAPEGFNCSARAGDIVRLERSGGLGPSGSGKSTVFAALLGFVAADEGRISCGGVDIDQCDPAEWRRLFAWIPQRPTFTGGTVADELAVATSDQPDGLDPSCALGQVSAAHLVHRRVDSLSTGERQRVAVARALLRLQGHARILLADEPTASLDAANARKVNDALRDSADRGAAVLLASHRPDTAATTPDTDAVTDIPAAPEAPPARARLRDLVSSRMLIGAGIGSLSLLSGIALAATSAWLIARASQQPPILSLSVAVVGVRAFALSRAVLRYLERLATHDAALRDAGRLRVRLWEALVRLGPVRAARYRRGDGLAHLVDDADVVRDLVPRVIVPPAVAIVAALGAIVIEFAVLPAAGAVLGGALLIAAIDGPIAALAAERRATAAAEESRRDVAAHVLALLDGSAELLAFGADGARRTELAVADAQLGRRARRGAFGAGAASGLITLAIGIAVLGGCWLGTDAVARGVLAPELAPLLVLVPLAATEAVGLLPAAAQHLRSLRKAQAHLEAVLAAPPTNDPRTRSDGAVELDDVVVHWPGAGRPALCVPHLRVPAGAHVAVVGPSGGGKSTLVSVLLGFLQLESGQVRAPQPVTWCPQEPQLVATTVRENLLLAAPRASDEHIAQALRTAGLDEWQDRLDAFVEPGGTALSGGEAQRLALTRALLVEDAQLVLLDEPTAHLDIAKADEVLAEISRAWRGRTIVHVTHRWSDTAHADMVLHIRDGEITVEHPTETGWKSSRLVDSRTATHGRGPNDGEDTAWHATLERTQQDVVR